jgi:hypothetical protein
MSKWKCPIYFKIGMTRAPVLQNVKVELVANARILHTPVIHLITRIQRKQSHTQEVIRISVLLSWQSVFVI